MSTSLLTKREVAARLRMSVYGVEKLIDKGLLPVVPAGGESLPRYCIREMDVERYISENVHHKGFERAM
jgi:excisionase family DNA binding protein